MRKAIAIPLLIVMFIVMAFVPFGQVSASLVTATPTQTVTAPVVEEVGELLPDGMEIWCLPDGIPYPKNAAEITKPEEAIDVFYDGETISYEGPSSGCFVFLPDEDSNAAYKVAIYDQSNTGPWYTRSFNESQDGLIAILKHSYIINPPFWEVNYRIELLDGDSEVVFEAPFQYSRMWAPDKCWNGKMPNPVTMLCERQQDQHPWDAWYGKPMPTSQSSED